MDIYDQQNKEQYQFKILLKYKNNKKGLLIDVFHGL